MLTVMPPRLTDEERALLTVVRWLRRFDWDRMLVGLCAAFHLLGAFTIAAAPAHQLITPGTAPVFDLAPRIVWALLFLAAGLAAVALVMHTTVIRQLLTWYLVIPIGFTWSGTFLLNVAHGGGSAMGAIAWPTLLAVWAIAAIRIALGRR